MPHLFLPPKVTRQLAEESREFDSVIERACHEDATCREWNRELVRLDPNLRMMRAPDCQIVGTPLVPGCYHIVNKGRHGGPTTVIPVERPGGGFTLPPGRLLDQLKGMDQQDTRVVAMRDRIAREQEAAGERAKERTREERQAEILERWKASDRAFVSMDDSTPWTQNSRGRRPKKKAT